MVVLGKSRIFKLAPLGPVMLGPVMLILGTLSVSACAIATPATITSTTSSAPITAQAINGVELIGAPDETGLRAALQSELTRALGARGVPEQSGADHIADFAVSERPAATGLLPVSEETDAAGHPEPAFKSRWYDKCKPSRISASLVIYARANGTIATKASGEFLACPGDHSQLDDLADLLVEQAIAPQ